MSHNKICEECWCPINPESTIDLCWDCQRLEKIRSNPKLALMDESLSRLAFDNGLKIEPTGDGGAKVINIFEYEDRDEQWREDLNKINLRHKQKHGKRPRPKDAWDAAAQAAARRARAKFADNRLALLKRKGKDYIGTDVACT